MSSDFFSKKNLKRTTAKIALASCIISDILTAPLTVYAGQAEANVDETLYLNLDYYGNTEKANIVKGIDFNGTDSYTDFGNYIKIINMSDAQNPEIKNGSVTFKNSQNGKFFFQGELDKTKIAYPQTFDVTYKLNGVTTDAEKLAGANGLIEIDINCIPNKQASQYMKDNMMLFVALPVDIQKCYSVDAPESQTMTLGQYTGIVFTALPGQEGHFVVRLGTKSFETIGIVFSMAPGTVGTLNKIKDIKEIKDDFRNDTNAMLDSVDNVMDNVIDMNQQLEMTNQIIDQLQSGKDKIHGNANVIFDGTNTSIQELNNLSNSLTPISEDLNTASGMVNDINQNFTVLDADLVDSYIKLKSLSYDLKDLSDAMDDTHVKKIKINDISSSIKETTNALNKVNTDINKLTNKNNINDFKASASEISKESGLGHIKNHSYETDPASMQVKTDVLKMLSKKMSGTAVTENTYKTAFKTINGLTYFGIENSEKIADILYAALQSKSVKEQQAILAKELQTSPRGLEIINEVMSDASNIGLTEEEIAKKISQQALYEYSTAAVLSKSDKTYIAHLKDLEDLQNKAEQLENTTIGSTTSQLTSDINGLTDILAEILKSSEELTDSDMLDDMTSYINSITNSLNEIMEAGSNVAYNTAITLNALRFTIDDIDSLLKIMILYHNDAQKTINDSQQAIRQIQSTSGSISDVIATINSTLKAAEPDLSAAADNSFKTGRTAVNNGKKIIENTKTVKETGNNLRNTINNKLDEEEADNNFLNMDPEAKKISLTSEKNQEPTSIAIICRTEEISCDSNSAKSLDAEIPEETTSLLARIKAVFIKLQNAIRSIF